MRLREHFTRGVSRLSGWNRRLRFGPKDDVPGIGSEEINTALDARARNVAPGPELEQLTWDYAQLVNQQVPDIWYATKVYQFPYSSKKFTNWPPTDKNGSSRLWDIIGANVSAGISLTLQQGYIVPK